MSDIEQVQPDAAVPAEEKKGGGLGAAVVGLGAGATTAYFVDKNQTGKFAEKMVGEKVITDLEEKIGKEADTTKKAALEKELKELNDARADNKTVKKVFEKKETTDFITKETAKNNGAKDALEMIEKGGEGAKIEVSGKGLKVTPKEFSYADKAAAEAAGLQNIAMTGDKVTGGNFVINHAAPKGVKGELAEDAVKGLNALEKDAGKDAKTWVKAAAETIEKEAGAIKVNAFKKNAAFGTGLKNASTSGKLLGGAAVLAATVVGYKVIASLGNGKHVKAVNAGRANEQTAGVSV